MKTLPWTFLLLGMLLYAAVWWATDVEARECSHQRRQPSSVEEDRQCPPDAATTLRPDSGRVGAGLQPILKLG